MKVVFSTSDVHARDRLHFWREEACKATVAHEFQTNLGRTFNGKIRAGSLGHLALAIIETDACTVRRTERCIKRAVDDDFLLHLQLAGSMTLHQDGRDAAVKPNDVYLLDPRRTFWLDMRSSISALIIKVPRWELQARLGDVAAWLTARPVARNKPVAALASGFFAMLPERADGLERSAGAKIAQQVLDLAALAFGEVRSMPALLSSSRSTTLMRLRRIIEDKLFDPSLRPACAAAAAGISVRYANALLAKEGTSLERFIVLRRLQHSRRVLEDPTHASRTVSDIAFSHGFSDLSHFARRFKAQFGCSPSECRPRPK